MGSEGGGPSAVRIVLPYPALLGTYGDRGNAIVLAVRARLRGIPAEVIEVAPARPIPLDGDIYLLGGAEDAAQRLATDWLDAHAALQRAVQRGAVLLAVCAGIQMLGNHVTGADGRRRCGLGLIDATTAPLRRRAVGELLADAVVHPDLGQLTGFENHRGGTTLGPSMRPLGRVRRGVGNDRRVDGVVHGRLIGTYLHGPVLARNPDLADLLLGWVLGAGPAAPPDGPARSALPPVDMSEVNALRATLLGRRGAPPWRWLRLSRPRG